MTKTVKQNRNHVIDFFKIIAAIGIFIQHAYCIAYQTGMNGLLAIDPDGYSWLFCNMSDTPLWGWLNYYLTLDFYTFMAGYWFMNYFKKVQRKGILKKGKDLKLILRYLGHNYAAYEPLMLYGILFGFVLYFFAFPSLFQENPVNLLHSFFIGIPDLLGLSDWVWSPSLWMVYSIAPYTENLTDTSMALISFGACNYYLSHIMFALVIFFAIFTLNETFGATIFSFYMYTQYCINFGTGAGWSCYEQFGINFDFMRLMGPACLGIWGWYVVDHLRSLEPTAKVKRNLTLAGIFCNITLVWLLLTGDGGQVQVGIIGGALNVIVLANMDYITPVINKCLDKIPGINYLDAIAVSIFLHHYPIVQAVGEMRFYVGGPSWLMDMSIDDFCLYGIILLLALGVVYCFIDKFAIKPFSKWLRKVTHCEEPVFTEEEMKKLQTTT